MDKSCTTVNSLSGTLPLSLDIYQNTDAYFPGPLQCPERPAGWISCLETLVWPSHLCDSHCSRWPKHHLVSPRFCKNMVPQSIVETVQRWTKAPTIQDNVLLVPASPLLRRNTERSPRLLTPRGLGTVSHSSEQETITGTNVWVLIYCQSLHLTAVLTLYSVSTFLERPCYSLDPLNSKMGREMGKSFLAVGGARKMTDRNKRLETSSRQALPCELGLLEKIQQSNSACLASNSHSSVPCPHDLWQRNNCSNQGHHSTAFHNWAPQLTWSEFQIFSLKFSEVTQDEHLSLSLSGCKEYC